MLMSKLLSWETIHKKWLGEFHLKSLWKASQNNTAYNTKRLKCRLAQDKCPSNSHSHTVNSPFSTLGGLLISSTLEGVLEEKEAK